MEDPFYYEKLHTLNQVYHHALPPYDGPLVGLDAIRTPLYPHQRTLVHHMKEYVQQMGQGTWVDHQTVHGKVGIIGEGIGSGKTLSVLAYLASCSSLSITSSPSCSEITPYSTRFFYSHPDPPSLDETRLVDLIIVPHALFQEWRHEIDTHTTLSYVALETRRMLRGDTLAQEMIQRSFVLTTNKCYKYVNDYATKNGIRWNQIFLDEASTLYMSSSDPPLRFCFLWLITHQWIPLLFKNASFHRSPLYALRSHIPSLHPELATWLAMTHTQPYEASLVSSGFLKEYLTFHHPQRYRMVLRNPEFRIREELRLPSPQLTTIQCRPSISLSSLVSYYLNRQTHPQPESRHIPSLFQSLGISFQSLGDYLPHHPPAKHPLIRRMMEDQECVVCMERCEYPTMVSCCYHLYCGKCILRSILLSGKCPTCRDHVLVTRMTCFTPLLPMERIQTKSKLEVCLDWIRNHPSGRFLVYSAFDNVFYQLFEEIDRMGRKAERTENHLFSLLRSIRNFKTGATQILFLSNVDVVRGLSFPFVTHLIFYHDLPSYEKKSLLVQAAHRVGRTQPLHVIQLQSEFRMEESSS